MYDNTQFSKGNSGVFDPGFSIDPISVLTASGFALVIFSTFLDFTPVVAQSWRAGGVGLPVMLSCMAGFIFALRKNYFTAFFIGIFAAFFLTHEVIIIYDNKAIELGQELMPDGWFRSVIMVYQDALQTGFGAFWGMIGTILASVFPLIGMAAEVRRKNLEAGYLSKKDAQRDEKELFDESEPEDGETEETEWADQFFNEDESKSADRDDPYTTKKA
ncbi:MAG: hypothetical protein CVV41_09955 [Candidatus Riflebacteria bacterium HGW-Riflebacteria-1]|nr:MAG: hypothetical protein CVV41_09955 [Candidatus Riflebacteria bacterium HGW-Riflebacteria-1]